MKIALVTFETPQQYSYFTDIEGMEKGDLLLVPTGIGYSIGVFEGYTNSIAAKKKATKWVVKNLREDIKEFEFLYGEE